MRFRLRRIARSLVTPNPFLIAFLVAVLAACAPERNPNEDSVSSPQAGELRASKTPAIEPSIASGSSLLGARDGNWQAYAGDIGSTKYTPLAEIDASNVASLEIAWRRPALDAYYSTLNPNQRFSSNYVAAPVVIDGVAYIPNAVGLVESFDAATGETLWVQEPVDGADGFAKARQPEASLIGKIRMASKHRAFWCSVAPFCMRLMPQQGNLIASFGLPRPGRSATHAC